MNNLLSSFLFSVNNDLKIKQLKEEQEKNKELQQIPKSIEEEKLKLNTHIHKKDKLNYKINTKSQETRIRRIMENFFKVPFDKVRPAFLKNEKTGRNLELDMYNKDLNIAIEVQGQQHLEYLPHFHKDEQQFKDQKYRDHIKYVKCKENCVKLIVVYYYEIKENMLDTEVLEMILTKLNEL